MRELVIGWGIIIPAVALFVEGFVEGLYNGDGAMGTVGESIVGLVFAGFAIAAAIICIRSR